MGTEKFMGKRGRHAVGRGFTIVEIAVVLVIIGLLLGGILKGQELVNGAKVRVIADRQNSLKVIWYAFLKEFSCMPGDCAHARQYITGVTDGNGDGRVSWNESPLVFAHMTSAGYLRCAHCTETGVNMFNTPFNSITNVYGGVMAVYQTSDYLLKRGGAGVVNLMGNDYLAIHSGGHIPSNIAAEVDRKIDDGLPTDGDLVLSSLDPAVVNGADPAGNAQAPMSTTWFQCMSTPDGKSPLGAADLANDAPNTWRSANASPPVWSNCGLAVFI